ncbi:PP2C family serine/threonine-protein phosphatase [Evansella sp. AB-rgal1]|uniref:PP2C family protein-serine/threonine phosphatase n=1 Tax=Evansella sp. AB-rgal1 TaxID=3242696 RepID=UPI00359CEB08
MLTIAYHTDIGLKKKTNQDALLIKTANSSVGEVGLFVVCDGMGGLSHGELASASVIQSLASWFDKELPTLLFSDCSKDTIINELQDHIQKLNGKIRSYGEQTNSKLGTTVTAFLILDEDYFIVQIGDSRAYQIHTEINLLTKDQTLVSKEIERGNLTPEQGKKDPRRNVLLQCVGASLSLNIPITTGKVQKDAIYMLCSDGFHHRITSQEFYKNLHPEQLHNKQQMQEKAQELVELAKQRKETDNITVLLLRVS